ncbi:MAG: prepilin-type N-terminal cleavage/methylation domain-containing protein [Abditibacteriales bacterium]|nr:prepilin-type N-terminal cleavage/methylation domain-containing protein [Abditibacteriales bacterium]MDW8365597.1 prepilin-type N-terminal cleavage/methylation domain-containing protein [Abditibacteriales bacterium]
MRTSLTGRKSDTRLAQCHAARASSLRIDGFTLVELLVAMVILVIVMAAAAPSFVQMRREASLRAAARAMMATLNYARSTAASRAVQARVYFDLEARQFWMSVQQIDEDGRPTADFVPERTSLGQRFALPPRIEMVVQAEGAEGRDLLYTTFYPDGHADALQVNMKDEAGREKVIAVEPVTGRVEMMAPNEIRE